MRIRVLLFAALREAVGGKELYLEVSEDATVGELLATLESEHEVIRAYQGRVLISLNQQRQPLGTRLAAGDEVALLPPVSGGAPCARIQSEPLSLDTLIAHVRSPGCGGIVSFTGAVRDESRGHRIDHLEYEAYEPMAEREMERIGEEVRRRWPSVRIAMAHRVGRLGMGEAAVMIAAAAPHRAEAFEACRFAIDELKRTVPIWKKEFAEDGAYWVEETP